jgi:hypothetical protein
MWANTPMVPDWCDLCHCMADPRYHVESDNPLIHLVCAVCRTIYFPVPLCGEPDIEPKPYETDAMHAAFEVGHGGQT